MINVDKKELEQYVKNLKNVQKDAYPKAVRSTLDAIAFQTKKEYDKNVRKELTIRGNKKANIVMASIGYEKCSNTLEINKMASYTGQEAQTYGKETEQLKKQEFGESIISKTKYTVKATKSVRGGNFKNFVSRENFLAGMEVKRISDLTNHPAKTIKKQFQQAVGIVHKTIPEGSFIHFMPDDKMSGKKFGIYRLYNKGSREDENGRMVSKGNSIKFMYSFKDKTQALDPRPMLEPAAETIIKKSDEIFVKEAQRRIEKEMSKNLKK